MAQKRTMGQKVLYLIAFSGVVFLFASLLSIYSKGENQVVVGDMIAVSVAMLVVAVVLTFRNKDEVVQDERTVKIARKASASSWQLTYLLLAVQILIAQFAVQDRFAVAALSTMFFFMAVSQLALRMYYSRKGDVE
ncbi:Uncharacterised protein [uncultured archaeon]|nr:Uncharacterised protein [uncultured archaeon]